MKKGKKSLAYTVVAGLIVAFGLTACGVRGDLEPLPPKEKEKEANLVLPQGAIETA